MAGWGCPCLPPPPATSGGFGAHDGGHPGYMHQEELGQSEAARALPFHGVNSSQNAAPSAQRTQPGDTCSAAGGTSAFFFTSFLLESTLRRMKYFQAELILSGLSHVHYRKGCHRTRTVAKLSLTGVMQPSILLHCVAFSRDGSWLRA